MKLIKFKNENFLYPQFGIVEKNIVKPIKNNFKISELFQAINKQEITTSDEINLNEITPLPPTDEHVHIYCAGLNYIEHATEMKMPLPKNPIFFSKSYGTICGAYDDIIYPSQTSLLDYEIELGIIIGRQIGKDDLITENNLNNYILGITTFNDITARDIQLQSGQWFLGKNFRSFAPTGPFIQILNNETLNNLNNLHLSLQVFNSNGEPYETKKQWGNTKNMIFPPHILINTLKNHFTLFPGDIIATGTPCGVALSKPSHFKMRLAEIFGISQNKRIEIFIKNEIKNNQNYLKEGDLIISRIFSDHDEIDLGEQKNRIIRSNNSL